MEVQSQRNRKLIPSCKAKEEMLQVEHNTKRLQISLLFSGFKMGNVKGVSDHTGPK